MKLIILFFYNISNILDFSLNKHYMRLSQNPLITETQVLKLPRLNSTGRYDEPQSKRSCKKDRFYVRPEMKKMLYTPFENSQSKKVSKKQMLVQSCLLNKNSHQIKQQAFQQKIQTFLTDNISLNFDHKEPIILKNKLLISKQAPFQYYKQYKKLGKRIQRTNTHKQNFTQSPYLAMLQKTQRLQILPMTLGLIKFQGQNNILNLNNYNLGDKYITAMSAGLKKAKLIEKCFLSSNRMTNKGFRQLVKCLNHEVSTLDVSFNRITQLDDKLMQLITHPQGHLQKLNLENNLIRKKDNISALIGNVGLSKHLKVLNLRANGIGNDCSEAIYDLIDMNIYLEELYIGRNFLTAKTAHKVFELLVKNKNVKVFDYSLNNLGDDESNTCAKSIANCLTKNKYLQHVDLSSNNFSEEGSKIIAEGLEPNKKLYGFHFSGNQGYVDSKGFLNMEQKQLTQLHSLVQMKIDSYNINYRRQNVTAAPKMFKNVCWICQGWYEQEFKFNIPQDFKQQKIFVYLHFDFQLFQPRLINISEKNIKYTTMVPPTKYRYFFTFDHKQHLDKYGKNTKLQFPQNFTYQMYHQLQTFNVGQLSQRSKGKPKKIVNDWDEIIINTLPRSTGLVSNKEKVKWTYEKSVWAKEWKLDNDDLLKKCFERDWKCSKLMNLVKNQQDQDKVKQRLCQSYKAIKLAYRYFSSWSPFGDTWAISNNAWTQFCQQAKIVNKDTPLKITDLTFITTNSMSGADWKGNVLVPERGLIRFQFMECLVRLAEEKYKKLGVSENFADSIQLMLKEHILPLSRSLSFESWRGEKYFIEQMDILVKKYRSIFSFIYRKNSKLRVKPGEKPFMCLNEFRLVMQRCNLAGSMVLQRDIYVCYNFSMMTQVDQLQNERFIKMSQIQFIEGLARCASILPKTCTLSTQDNKQTLHLKFEWLINQLKNTQCNQDIKNQFTQQNSIFDLTTTTQNEQ